MRKAAIEKVTAARTKDETMAQVEGRALKRRRSGFSGVDVSLAIGPEPLEREAVRNSEQ